jgi:hypothetical protein
MVSKSSSPVKETAVLAALQAGEILMHYFHKDLTLLSAKVLCEVHHLGDHKI